MVRRYNPRVLAREARAWRAEHLRDQVHDARENRRAKRRVQAQLESVERYAYFRKAVTKNDVQAVIDTVELQNMNAERSALGLPLFATMEEALAPPPSYDIPPAPPPYKSSDYA